ncbi:MAG: ASCH domain-containing protein [Alphaproteobacteria bacterium]|nr:ASCH domain-containing protein [Alphaproteobacteria bacterium]
MHYMKVQTKYYNLLKDGVKTIELRLYDEKRQQIQVGDAIQFSDLSNPDDTFVTRVTALHRATDFTSLCALIHPQQAGFNSPEDLVNTMQQFYSSEKQQQYGVVGIEIHN